MESTLKLGIDNYVVQEEDDEACAYAMHLSVSHIFHTVFNAAVELEVFDIIAGAGPGAHLSAADIVCQLPVAAQNPDAAASMLDRMLRLLVCHSLLTCKQLDGAARWWLYGLAPAGKYFVKKREGGSLASMLRLASHRVDREVMLHLKDAILEGGNLFKKVQGMTIFEYMDIDPTLGEVFNSAMAGQSSVSMNKILENYRGFEGLTSLVDVGGGTGKSLNMIVSKYYPSIKGINFDLPRVIASAPSYPGIEHVGGDMFTNIPKGDAIMMKSIIHNWNEEQCLILLKNCYAALPKDGKVIIIDMVVSEAPESSVGGKFATQLDNLMLFNSSGRERTEKEFEALCHGSGFSDFRVFCCAYVFYVVEFYK